MSCAQYSTAVLREKVIAPYFLSTYFVPSTPVRDLHIFYLLLSTTVICVMELLLLSLFYKIVV